MPPRRSREVAVRLALGASRLRLVRQLVIESLVLAIGAALLALPLAWSGLQLIAASFVMLPMPLDGTVVAGALVTAFLTALGFGLVPALQATGQHPSAALGTSPAGSGGTRAESRGRRVLVAGQVALSLGLLASVFQLTSTLESWSHPARTRTACCWRRSIWRSSAFHPARAMRSMRRFLTVRQNFQESRPQGCRVAISCGPPPCPIRQRGFSVGS